MTQETAAVVLLPGIGGDGARDFGFLGPMLSRHRRVLTLDYPTTATNLAGLAEFARAAIARAFPGEEVQLVGHSLGAAVALELAAITPTRAVVLIAGVYGGSPRTHLFAATWQRLAGLAELPKLPELPDSAELPESAGTSAREDFARFAALSGAFVEFEPARTLPWGGGPATDAHVELLASTTVADSAAQLTVPTLIIGAGDDAIVGAEQSRALFGAIDDARLVVIDSGHAALVERGAEVLSFVDPFLDNPGEHPAGTILPTARV